MYLTDNVTSLTEQRDVTSRAVDESPRAPTSKDEGKTSSLTETITIFYKIIVLTILTRHYLVLM